MEVMAVPSPDCFNREPGETCQEYAERRFSDMEATLAKHADEVCAVIVEPLVQCAGSMRMYDPIYLTRLREACDRFNVHLIADEIAVGFGRTGSMFACEQADITPDFMCLSKGLTGGYLPLSVTLTSEKIYRSFYDEYENLTAFLHSHSYTGNPLACTAALATLDIFTADNVLERNKSLATAMHTTANPLQDHPYVGDVRQTGMILAVEMVQDKMKKTPFPWQERRGLTVYQHGLKNGVLLRPLGNVIYLMPPYVITEEQIELCLSVAAEGIDIATKQ
jgi:adenosylmethionine-8-amino-7-oxononanoate aminotransferase